MVADRVYNGTQPDRVLMITADKSNKALHSQPCDNLHLLPVSQGLDWTKDYNLRSHRPDRTNLLGLSVSSWPGGTETVQAAVSDWPSQKV